MSGILKENLRLTTREKGQKLDEAAFRNLYLPTASFTILNKGNEFPDPYETVGLEDFIELLEDEYYEAGYSEQEIGRTVDEYNGIAHVFQAFESKDSEGMEARGISSYQLIFFKNRWWIVSVVWTPESDSNPIPEKYLNK